MLNLLNNIKHISNKFILTPFFNLKMWVFSSIVSNINKIFFNVNKNQNNKLKNDVKNIKNDVIISTKTVEELFLKKYLEDFNNVKWEFSFSNEENTDAMINEIKNHISNLSNAYVVEYTPKGNVFMKYNSVTNSFEYYSNSIVPFEYLEVVARKYTKTFKCKPLYVKMEIIEKKITEKKTVILKKMNKYNYCGKLTNLNLLKGIDPIKQTAEKISFSEFKKKLLK